MRRAGSSLLGASQVGAPAGIVPDLGIAADLNGAPVLSAASAWNTPIDEHDVHAQSTTILNSLEAWVGVPPTHYGIKSDFGNGTYLGALVGMPYIVVDFGSAADHGHARCLCGPERPWTLPDTVERADRGLWRIGHVLRPPRSDRAA